jgi:competence protein ComEC
VHAFAPWSILFLTLAVLSAVIWRTWALRLTALIFLALGIAGAVSGRGFDIAVGPNGDAAAARLADGKLAIIGQRPNPFQVEQWLRADGDSREAGPLAHPGSPCDKLGCTARLADGSVLALIARQAAFEEDCLRADIVISRLKAPATCAAPLILDRERLAVTGAMALQFSGNGFVTATARSSDEDRPWSRPPRPRKARPPTAEPETPDDTSASSVSEE